MAEDVKDKDFISELGDLINKHGLNDRCNTPDFILAKYLYESLSAFMVTTREREHWYGVGLDIDQTPEEREKYKAAVSKSKGTSFNRCLCCNRTNIQIIPSHTRDAEDKEWYYGQCTDCGNRSAYADGREAALKNWNEMSCH